MNIINIAVCDDDPVFRQILISELEKYSEDSKTEVKIVSFSNGLELIISEMTYNVIFLDYKMSILNGVETAKKLRKSGVYSPIVFVTGYEGIKDNISESGAYGYLNKPVEPEKLYDIMKNLSEKYKNSKAVNFDSDENHIRILSSDIFYIEKNGKGSTIHTEFGDHETQSPISCFSEILPEHFIKCGRALIVNSEYIKEIEPDSIMLENNSSLKFPGFRHSFIKREYENIRTKP